MKKLIFFLAVGLSLVIPFEWLAGLGYSSTGPSISISPDDYDAGDLTRAPDTVYKVFQVFNTGDALLSIAKIKYT
ncbi:MAG TPA: hypothetical protein VLR91_03570 [Thermodesulfobacteriota bacterium]|nr:hypothetical protein [Thermodesulfobacteriota bacterium]